MQLINLCNINLEMLKGEWLRGREDTSFVLESRAPSEMTLHAIVEELIALSDAPKTCLCLL